jgi:amidohydrolase
MSTVRELNRIEVKAAVRRAIEASADEIIRLARDIYEHPEPGFTEERTAKVVAAALAKAGVNPETGIAITGMKGVRTFEGEGPTVAVIGELDAVKAPGHPAADMTTGAAHACGHHTQLGALIGAAIGLGVPEVASTLSGRAAFIATPAEEFIDVEMRWGLREAGRLGLLSGKQEMIRLGVFDDVDMAMMIHTSSSKAQRQFIVGGTSNAHVVHYVRFLGKAAHAGGAPHQGVNALQAAMLALSAINTQRETFEAENQTRVHGIITRGGVATNAVPAEVVYEGRVRGRTMAAVDKIAARVEDCYRAGALAMGARLEIVSIPGYLPLENNQDLSRVFTENVITEFGKDALMTQADTVNAGGSTDMGDLSQIMPALHPYVAAADGTGHGIDYIIADYRRAVVDSAISMALTVVDLLSDNATEARGIIDSHRPSMTRSEYVQSQEARLRKIEYRGE